MKDSSIFMSNTSKTDTKIHFCCLVQYCIISQWFRSTQLGLFAARARNIQLPPMESSLWSENTPPDRLYYRVVPWLMKFLMEKTPGKCAPPNSIIIDHESASRGEFSFSRVDQAATQATCSSMVIQSDMIYASRS